MPYWFIAAAVVSAVSAYSQHRANQRANDNQAAWNLYNARSQHQVSLGNIAAQSAINRFNAIAAMTGGKVTAQTAMANAEINAEMIRRTAVYNDSLLAVEEEQIWDAWELDSTLYREMRRREQGQIEAIQSASGTVMGIDSNAEVIIDQQTQAVLDQLIIQHNAESAANDILNARAQNAWEAEMQVRKVMWEGAINSASAMANASLQAAGNLATGAISAIAGTTSAGQALQSGLYGGQIQYGQNANQSQAQFNAGMFGAAQSLVQAGQSYNASTRVADVNSLNGTHTINYQPYGNTTNPGASLIASNEAHA